MAYQASTGTPLTTQQQAALAANQAANTPGGTPGNYATVAAYDQAGLNPNEMAGNAASGYYQEAYQASTGTPLTTKQHAALAANQAAAATGGLTQSPQGTQVGGTQLDVATGQQVASQIDSPQGDYYFSNNGGGGYSLEAGFATSAAVSPSASLAAQLAANEALTGNVAGTSAVATSAAASESASANDIAEETAAGTQGLASQSLATPAQQAALQEAIAENTVALGIATQAGATATAGETTAQLQLATVVAENTTATKANTTATATAPAPIQYSVSPNGSITSQTGGSTVTADQIAAAVQATQTVPIPQVSDVQAVGPSTGGTSGGTITPITINISGMTPGASQYVANQMVTSLRNAGMKIT